MQASAVDTLVVFSCDQNYFPLLKGLVLSALEKGPLGPGLALAFLDFGCDESSLRWLAEHDVQVRRPDPDILGGLGDPELGYQRSQVCRPLLPKIFPEASVLIWLDTDTWVQDGGIFSILRGAVVADRNALCIAPECHYTYTAINDNYPRRRAELVGYYEPLFGTEVASQMCLRPVLNSGFFAMAADNPLWATWESEVRRIYLSKTVTYTPQVRHMAEQISLNVVAAREGRVLLVDPLYNYLCLWTPPFRDPQGIVRVALPPHVPVGLIHLAGGWKHFGAEYFRRGLLYRGGDYLSEEERSMLFRERASHEFR